MQSAGGAVAWQVDKHATPLAWQLGINWILTSISYPLLALLVALAVKDKDDLDETKDEKVVDAI